MVTALQTLCEKHHLNWEIMDSQPAFEALSNSSLFSDLKRSNPEAVNVKKHIAVECGIF